MILRGQPINLGCPLIFFFLSAAVCQNIIKNYGKFLIISPSIFPIYSEGKGKKSQERRYFSV
nr:MAG TPA: hypothetical protein [Caudoviricetes sp.]